MKQADRKTDQPVGSGPADAANGPHHPFGAIMDPFLSTGFTPLAVSSAVG